MRAINPKCTNKDSFKYSILISLHYYESNTHPERISQLKHYLSKYNFKSDNYNDFENYNSSLSLNVLMNMDNYYINQIIEQII